MRAIVVGAGPNGLAAAIELARHGVAVEVLEAADRPGGGTRTSQLTRPGLLHDDCSAFHPTGIASPFLRQLPLERFGLRWLHPELPVAHPLPDGRAAAVWPDVERTAVGLGADGPAWRTLFAPLVRDIDPLLDEVMGPVLHRPQHPVLLARFGLRALLPVPLLARRWRDEPARALFGGIAAHLVSSLRRPLSSAVGLVLGATAQAAGWPVAAGGSQAVSTAMVDLLEELGGTVTLRSPVSSLDALGSLGSSGSLGADVVLLDVSPRAALDIVGERLARRTRAGYRRYRYGPAAYKVDLAVRGDIPWRNDECRRAGTVHLGGTLADMVRSETAVARGTAAVEPFVLVGQQYLADPSRSAGGLNPVWAYAHVPHGYDGDATGVILDRIEAFAPGFRAQVVDCHVRNPAALEAYDGNYVGGDIAVGANGPVQLVVRPRPALDPYATGVPGVFLCSSATPPGGGVHGMCGWHAARSALRHLGVARRGG